MRRVWCLIQRRHPSRAVETDPGPQIDIVRDPDPWDQGCRDADQGRRQMEAFHPRRHRACRHSNWRAGTVFHVRPGIATAISHRSALHRRGECLRHSPVAQFGQFRVIVQIGSVHGHPFQSADLFRFAPPSFFDSYRRSSATRPRSGAADHRRDMENIIRIVDEAEPNLSPRTKESQKLFDLFIRITHGLKV